ncbi:MAG: cytochrome c peroxidase, partial [Planctomycetota bacterium]
MTTLTRIVGGSAPARVALLVLGAATLAASGASKAEGQGSDRFPTVEAPAVNPTTAAKALLGKALFWDEQLSASGTMACGTCHRFEAGGSDPRPGLDPASSLHPGADGIFGSEDDVLGSPGVVRQGARGKYEPAPLFGLAPQVTRRRAPSVINAAFAPKLLWDGRAEGPLVDPLDGQRLAAEGAALEIQALEPPLSSVEMAHTAENWPAIAARVEQAAPLALASDLPAELAAFTQGRSYPELFHDAFGTRAVSPARILFALAAYQRTLISDQSPWDDFLAGDLDALTAPQQTGRDLFFGQAKCSECHSGPLFSDGLFHDIGVRPDHEDLGRGAITGLAEDEGRFKTPGLRNVELRAPYFHTGGASSLGAVVSFYDDG